MKDYGSKSGKYRKASYGESRGRDNFNYGSSKPQMYSAICDKCGSSCQVPFKPSGDKPIYCNDCFRPEERSYEPRGGSSSNIEDQLRKINKKLDAILAAL